MSEDKEYTYEELLYYDEVYNKVLNGFKQSLQDSKFWIVACQQIGMPIEETAAVIIDHFNNKSK